MNISLTYLLRPKGFIAILLLACNLVITTQSPSREYQLKAAFLFNFTQFVEWPEEAMPEAETPWIIGVLGDNPFNGYLDEIVAGEKVNGHPVTVQYYKNTADVKTCHILYINLADPKKQEQAIAGLENQHILTVSDAAGFPQSGGMIRLFTKENKIKLQVNLEATKTGSLVISSKLLKLAEIYIPR